jgi:hypothetical protein
LTIEGQHQTITGPITCADNGAGGYLVRAAPASKQPTDGIAATIFSSPDSTEIVGIQIRLGDIELQSKGQDATATKSGNTYKVIGQANDIRSTPIATKHFEVDITCP